jgi:outer membrane protein assembly factor BamB
MKWMYRTDANIAGNSAVAADGTVYVGALGRLVALTSAGTEKWAAPFKFTSTATPGSIVVDSSGTAYFGADDKRLYAVNPDGTLKWSCATGGAIRYGVSTSPDGSIIYATASDGRAYAINAANGSILWKSAAINAMYNCAVADDGSIYVGSTNGKLYSFSANGGMNWTFQMQSKATCAPAIAADGTVYIGSQDTKLYALSSLGQEKWRFRTGGPIYSAPTIDAAGHILFGEWPGTLCSLDPVDGALEWYRDLGAAIYAPPILDQTGAVYIVCIDGTITKFTSVPVPAEAPEPSVLAGLAVMLAGLGAKTLSRCRSRA